MRARLLASALLVATALAAMPRPATAQPAERRRGLELNLGLGVAGCTDWACAGFDPSAHTRLEVLFRIVPYFAAGLHMGFQFGNPDRTLERWVDRGWSMLLGGELRGILPVGKLEAWVGLALGFMRMQIDEDNNDPNEIDRWWTNGFGLGVGFGTNYFVHPKVALGLDFWLYKGFFDEGCTYQNDGNTRTETCGTFSDDERAQIGIVFTFGLSATFFLPL